MSEGGTACRAVSESVPVPMQCSRSHLSRPDFSFKIVAELQIYVWLKIWKPSYGNLGLALRNICAVTRAEML